MTLDVPVNLIEPMWTLARTAKVMAPRLPSVLQDNQHRVREESIGSGHPLEMAKGIGEA